MLHFRQEVAGFLGQLPGSPLNAATTEPWHAKDVFQLLAELIAFSELDALQLEVKAVLIQAVSTFGLEAIAVIGVLLQGRRRTRRCWRRSQRCVHGWGVGAPS